MARQDRTVVAVPPDAPDISEQHEVRDADGRLIGTGRQYEASHTRPATLPHDIPFFEGVRLFHFVNEVPDSVAVTYETGPHLEVGHSLLARLVSSLEADGWNMIAQAAPPSVVAAILGTRGDRRRSAVLSPNGDLTLLETDAR